MMSKFLGAWGSFNSDFRKQRFVNKILKRGKGLVLKHPKNSDIINGCPLESAANSAEVVDIMPLNLELSLPDKNSDSQNGYASNNRVEIIQSYII